MDIERARFRPDWRHWKKLKDKDLSSDQYSEWVPRNILYFDRFVEELFATKNLSEAMEMLEHPTAKAFLINLAGARNTTDGKSDNAFSNLFQIDEVTKVEEIDLNNPEDDALRALENSVDN